MQAVLRITNYRKIEITKIYPATNFIYLNKSTPMRRDEKKEKRNFILICIFFTIVWLLVVIFTNNSNYPK